MTSHSTSHSYIVGLDSPEATVEVVGGKAASLARMAADGLPVPDGFYVTTHAYGRHLDENHLAEKIQSLAAEAKGDDPATLDLLSGEIGTLFEQARMPTQVADAISEEYQKMGADAAVAVRSSATAEDLPDMSFAGQLETYLNVRGSDAVLDAVKRCWASLWTARAIGYRILNGIKPREVSIAVVVQELIPAEAAGVIFTANPLTGSRNELMINAAWGLGEAIVSGGVTPDTIVIEKRTGKIASERIGSKDVMTIRLAQGTCEEPVPDEKRDRPALEPSQAAELARFAQRIERLYGRAMDIEWAIADGRIFILQARPVTALRESHAAIDWKVPRDGRQYWRSSVAELLPEPLSPLFATLALPLWTEETLLIVKAMGVQMLRGTGFRLVTINDYAYYDFTFGLRHSIVVLVTLPVLIPRVIRMLRSGRARWANEARPQYVKVTETWAGVEFTSTPTLKLLAGVRDIVKAAASYYVSIQSVLGQVNSSEALFTKVYNRLIRRKGDPAPQTFLLGFDSAGIRAEKSLYDMATWARPHAGLAEYLSRETGKEIARALGSSPGTLVDEATWREFTGRLGSHLKEFGHVVYNLDFSKSLPAEDPASIMETLKYFIAGHGRNPYERQAEAARTREQAAQSLFARLKGLRLWLFRRMLTWAQACAPLREDALADVGLGWPVVRSLLIEVGSRIAYLGGIRERHDVFWLKWEEVEEAARAIDSDLPVQKYSRAVSERREYRKRVLAVTPPVALPIKGGGRIFGLDLSRWMPAHSDQPRGDTIRGAGASPGRVTGAACVIKGPGEFDQMKAGDILVAKVTTPAWTPLFALASAIVTDVGGPLSHSSIVAREYGVPAVLGTGVATQRIRHGQRITVDGDRGMVTIAKESGV